jgi:hypothetical protein
MEPGAGRETFDTSADITPVKSESKDNWKGKVLHSNTHVRKTQSEH